MRNFIFILAFICKTGLAQDFTSYQNQLGGFFLPQFTFDVVESANNPDYKPHGFSYSAGISYKRIFKEKFWVRTGLFYSQLNDTYETPNWMFGIDSITILVHRVGIPFHAGYYFYHENPYFRAGIGGGLNLLFNVQAEYLNRTNSYSYVYNKDDVEDVGLEFNIHWEFLFRPHPKLAIGIEPHFNFNALPIIKIMPASNYLQVGGAISVSYTFS